MANDAYVDQEDVSNVDYYEFYVWTCVNNIAELIIDNGEPKIMSMIQEAINNKLRLKDV